jgi:haloacetate dehalogenase
VFEGFELDRVDVGEATLRVRHGGSGPAVLLLHGHPRTHATWHRVAPLLADAFTVVCPDTRGYGESSHPPEKPNHETYSKRAMAADFAELMTKLGHETFAVVGHDRGAMVAPRLALDHPDRVSRAVIMDGVPLLERLARCDVKFASMWWHWFFFAQTEKPAERVINADPDAWYKVDRELMGEEAYDDLRRALHDPEVVHSMLEDYRAGLTADREHDEADRAAGKKITCPVLLLWALGDDTEELYGDPIPLWADWAENVTGRGLDSGHHMAEEIPEELAAAIRAFVAEK